ncbi:hypothetical protein DFH28DRAFT_966215 [Melampsora americana]|nr:hypothetical protein DFH28DRAFT_966215 [Melampsora americana]
MTFVRAITKLKSPLPSNLPISSKIFTPIQSNSIGFHSRFFSTTFKNRISEDPFGFSQPKPGQTIQLREPIQTSTSNQTPQPTSTFNSSSPELGSAIFQRIANSRQHQIQDLKRFDESNRINRDEKATIDQLWESVSNLKVQSHSGPLLPFSSRVVRTMRIPPTSFLSRPATTMDVERAYKRIQFLVNSAGLRKEIYLNKRYEKPYLKRRRLKSERHRMKFAIEVQRRVQLISVMKLKGM